MLNMLLYGMSHVIPLHEPELIERHYTGGFLRIPNICIMNIG